jgi:hypothetical protein
MPQCQFLFSAVFLFQVFTEGNILRIRRNKSKIAYLSVTKTESKGETETSQEPAILGGGVAPLWPRHHMVWAPRAPTELALPPINSHLRENPRPKPPSTKSTVSHRRRRP